MPPRRGQVDLPQPILHPIASHATFTTGTSENQQQAGRQPGTGEEQPPPPPPPPMLPPSSSDSLSFSYLRSRKLEPYLPPPPDQQQPSSYLAIHNVQQHTQLQHQNQRQEGGPSQAQISPDSPPPEGGAAVAPPGAEGAQDVGEDEEDEEEEEIEEEEIDWKPRPFVTLTYAQSLDSMIASAPGTRTAISGASTKAMTHFLRSRHDALLVGVGTAVADDPGLNCRLEVEMGGGHQPRPVVLDPFARWAVGPESKCVALAREGKGLGPWVVHMDRLDPDPERVRTVEEVGGRYIPVELTEWAAEERGGGGQDRREGGEGQGQGESSGTRYSLTWDSILGVLWEEGINSVMVEGGGTVINDLLLLANKGLDVIDSVIITVAPVWLGNGGVQVAPERPVDGDVRQVPGPRLTDVMWTQMGDDMVLCGRIMR